MTRWLQFIFLLLTSIVTASAHIPRATETNTVSRILASGKINALVTTVPLLDGRPMPVAVLAVNDTNWPYRWHSPLEMGTGVHQLKIEVSLPFFTTNATSTFTNSFAAPRATNAYDLAGHVTKRVWLNGTNVARTQTLSWDARGRLMKVTERDALTNGYDWSAVYDPLGRRLRTTTIVTNGPLRTNATTTIVQYFDPAVEFLEVGVSVDGLTTWKLHGPDASGTYGAFEAIAPPPDLFCPVLPDARGNLHAVYDQRHGDLVWFKSRVTGYGAVPGHRPQPLGYGSDAASGSAWRGVWADLTGYYLRGHRYYDPESHRWLSADPLGHSADPSLMTFCGGDPINFDDPWGLDKNPAFNAASSGPANPWSDYTSALVGMYRWEGQTYSADQRQAAVRADYDDVVSFIGDRARWNDRVDEWVNSISGAHVTDHSLDERREISSILDWVPGVNVVKSAFQSSLGMDVIIGERVNPYGQLAMTALNVAPVGLLGGPAGGSSTRIAPRGLAHGNSRTWLTPPVGQFGPFFDNRGWATVRAERNLGLLNTQGRDWTWEHFFIRQTYFNNPQSSWLRGFGNSYANTFLRIPRGLNSSLGNDPAKRWLFRGGVIAGIGASATGGYMLGNEIESRWILPLLEDCARRRESGGKLAV
jgi:RHS repeat-associated protein